MLIIIKLVKVDRSTGSREDLKCFTIYGRGGHLGHMTNIILTTFPFLVPKAYVQNLIKNGPVVSEKSKF